MPNLICSSSLIFGAGSSGPYAENAWTATDMEGKLLVFHQYYNEHRTHAGRHGHPPVAGINADRSRANLKLFSMAEAIVEACTKRPLLRDFSNSPPTRFGEPQVFEVFSAFDEFVVKLHAGKA